MERKKRKEKIAEKEKKLLSCLFRGEKFLGGSGASHGCTHSKWYNDILDKRVS